MLGTKPNTNLGIIRCRRRRSGWGGRAKAGNYKTYKRKEVQRERVMYNRGPRHFFFVFFCATDQFYVRQYSQRPVFKVWQNMRQNSIIRLIYIYTNIKCIKTDHNAHRHIHREFKGRVWINSLTVNGSWRLICHFEMNEIIHKSLLALIISEGK